MHVIDTCGAVGEQHLGEQPSAASQESLSSADLPLARLGLFGVVIVTARPIRAIAAIMLRCVRHFFHSVD